MSAVIDYAEPGALTSLSGTEEEALAPVADNAVAICSPVHGLVLQPRDAEKIGLPPERLAENQIRPAAKIVAALWGLGPTPLSMPRDADQRVVGTCRHFTVLSCALLRYRGIPARARCGFATYFQKGQGLDHWVTEYWDQHRSKWVRVDSEILGLEVLRHPEELQPGEFLSGGEAWTAYREGRIDASSFGVYGTDNWGPGEDPREPGEGPGRTEQGRDVALGRVGPYASGLQGPSGRRIRRAPRRGRRRVRRG